MIDHTSKEPTVLIHELEAGDLIGGFYKHPNKSIQRRRIRKLMKRAEVAFVEQSRERSLYQSDLPKLMEALPWQSNLFNAKIPPTGGYEVHTRKCRSTNLQEYLTPIKKDRKKEF